MCVGGFQIIIIVSHTVGRVLVIAWFNDCVLGRSGRIANPIIAMIDPVPYYSIHARLCLRIYQLQTQEILTIR